MRSEASTSPLVTNQKVRAALKGRNNYFGPSGLDALFCVLNQGRRAPLRFALAPGFHISRLWRFISRAFGASYPALWRFGPMADWPDLFVIRQFFEPDVCASILAELQTIQGNAATIYGRNTTGWVDVRARKTIRLDPAEQTVKLVMARLWECKDAVEKHFAVTLKECEAPQFLRYREGDFFVAHQDGNTGLLNLDAEQRLISTVIILSRESEQPEPDAHCGGSLVFSDLRNRVHPPVEPGMLVAFRSETTHEVTPVTHGKRYSIASWYR